MELSVLPDVCVFYRVLHVCSEPGEKTLPPAVLHGECVKVAFSQFYRFDYRFHRANSVYSESVFCMHTLTVFVILQIHMRSSCMSDCMTCFLTLIMLDTAPTQFLFFPYDSTAFCLRFELNRAIHPPFSLPSLDGLM